MAPSPSPLRSGVPLVSGAWLIVDATAVTGLALAGAALFWAEAPAARWGLAAAALGLLACAGVVALTIVRRKRAAALGATERSGSATAPCSSPAKPSAASRAVAPPRALKFSDESVENLAALHKIVARTCCQHADGSGRVRVEAAREFFGRLDVAAVTPFVGAAELRRIHEFQRLLDRIAGALGEPASERLDALRATLPEAIGPAVDRAAALLGAARDPQAFREALTDACCEHADGRGWVVAAHVPRLLARTTPDQLRTLLHGVRPKNLLPLARLVGAFTRQLHAPSAELDALRGALLDAGRVWLPTTQQSDWILPFLAGLCCERADGGGKVDREAIRRLFDGLSLGRLGDRLAHVPPRELNGVAQGLARIATSLAEPHPAGFRALVDAIDEAIELNAIRLQSTLLGAPDVATLRRVIIEACCEDEEGGGYQNRRALHALFDGVDAEHFQPLVDAAAAPDRLRLSQLANRIDSDRRGESLSPGVLRFREMLSAAVQRDRAAEAAAHPVPTVEGESGVATASDLAGEGEFEPTWLHFKQASLVECSPQLAERFAALLDGIAADGEEGLRRILRRLWKGLRRDHDRLTVELSPDEAPNEWARKRFLAEALERSADRRAVPKLVALVEGRCEDPEYLDVVQPALARALLAMRDKRGVKALQRAQAEGLLSPITRRIVASARHSRFQEGELSP